MRNRWPNADMAMTEVTFPTLRFSKSGSEIQRAVDTRFERLDSAIASARADVARICKDRQIEVDEVLNAVTDTDHQTYSSKAFANAPRANAAVNALQEDLDRLRHLSYAVAGFESEKATLTRIKKNLQPERSFDLTFRELDSLGF